MAGPTEDSRLLVEDVRYGKISVPVASNRAEPQGLNTLALSGEMSAASSFESSYAYTPRQTLGDGVREQGSQTVAVGQSSRSACVDCQQKPAVSTR